MMKENQDSQSLEGRDGRSFTVRRLNSGDAAALQQFNDALEPRSKHFFNPHSYDNETVKTVLERSENGSDLVLGVFDGSFIIGYFFLWYYTEPVPLLGIGLLDRYQGQGLGKKMMAHLIQAARQNGNEGIELVTMQDNEAAFELYKKMKFRYVGDVLNTAGDGSQVKERAMFYEIKPGGRRFSREYRPPF